MYIKNLIEEHDAGHRKAPVSDWRAVEEALGRLDGKDCTLVMLEAEGETHMAVGGGAGQQYVVYATYDNETFHNLADPTRADETVYLVVGKQRGDYRARQVVSRAAALAAARAFAERGALESSLTWEEG